MTIFDTHAHLDHCDGVPEALEEAFRSGVVGIVAVGVDLTSNQKNLELKKKTQKPKICVALGNHPGNINPEEIEESLKHIQENIQDAVAIGEIGLDYWYKDVRKNEERKNLQREIFKRQLSLAKEFNLPVVIHSRGAWKDCLAMTKEIGITKAEFHWYSGPVDILDSILERGFFISATPSLAYSPQHQDAIKHAPIEQTLIETDTPVFYRQETGGFESRPKHVWKTLDLYAKIKNIKQEEAVEILNDNAKEFFGF